MFGSRLKTWMENYIGRPRKKDAQKEKSKENEAGGIVVESSESLACSDTGISFSSQQVLSSSATDNREGYSTTTMESEKSGMTHCLTAVSLPSPESAYSTGYSTDGASPGETGPPEYYINIRTGKHYFPSPAPTPTSPQPSTALPPLRYADRRPPTSFLCRDFDTVDLGPSSEAFRANPRVRTSTRLSNGFPPHLESFPARLQDSPRAQDAFSAPPPYYFDTLHFSKSPCKKSSISQLTSMKLFLKSPGHEKGKPKVEPHKTTTSSNNKKSSSKPKRWFKQPFQKFGHRRTDSCDESVTRNEPKKETPLEMNFRYVLSQETSASPRQRNRIKTNPWLPTEPMSSQNFHNLGIGFSPSLNRNRSCSNTPLQNRKACETDLLQYGSKRPNGKNEEPEESTNRPEKTTSRQAAGKPPAELSDRSEEDLTLNEMMGTYNESYVYEKETDILSDSDPTDCEDYGTDSEAENGGDERDSHDDELDFIDNGSLYECDDDFLQNTGECTYHEVHVKKNSFAHKTDRRKLRKESECRKNSRRDSKVRREKRREKTRKSFKHEDEERKRVLDENVKAKPNESVGGLCLSRALAQRMLARTASKSAEGTPVTGRRQKDTGALRESHIGGVSPANAGDRKSGKARDVVLIEFEADHKYNELMKEAESMLESLRNSPVIANRKEILHSPREDEMRCKGDVSAEFADFSEKAKTELRAKEQAAPAKKSPKELGLKLSAETPKKPKRLDLEKTERSSFRTRSSAHSPLDPLGPALRNFAVFCPATRDDRKASTSSSEDSEQGKAAGKEGRAGRWEGLPGSPVVPIAFQSVDLGKALAPYCPQSEPVKRKIYSCSKTYDKLVKRFETKSAILEESRNGKGGSPSLGRASGLDPAARSNLESCLRGNQGVFLRERRRGGEKISCGGILRRPSGRPCCPEKPQRRSFDVFRGQTKKAKTTTEEFISGNECPSPRPHSPWLSYMKLVGNESEGIQLRAYSVR